MKSLLIFLKGTRNSLTECKSRYPMHNELRNWLRKNYKSEQLNLIINEIEILVRKLICFYSIYADLDDEAIFERIKTLLNENELGILECHYRDYTANYLLYNQDSNENKTHFFNKLISLSIIIDGKEKRFCISQNGIVRKADLEKYFENKIGAQKKDITLDELYVKLLGSDTTNCDYSEIRECLSLHYDDLILRRKIFESVKEQVNYDKKEIQKTYSD
jgi:hypothetical protein